MCGPELARGLWAPLPPRGCSVSSLLGGCLVRPTLSYGFELSPMMLTRAHLQRLGPGAGAGIELLANNRNLSRIFLRRRRACRQCAARPFG